ncbi:hypothetical protein KUTeg_015765 [Tegillarca granosa]|uniref:Uncharacterized protein n=1 Tax=Tegillarca granosa TaxID=220873 RepID=A0ABQ9EN88_TEGGR|nr:hypothetical protein KUTeg_015765 [Tegillarca granosa]
MATTPTTPNQEEESVEVMEDVSTILKNEIQSICTRLANLGEESLFLSAKVAEKETTKLGSDTGFLFMSKFNIVQQFYHFVEDFTLPILQMEQGLIG